MKRPEPNPAWSEEVKALHGHDMEEIWDRSINVHVWNAYHNQLDTYLGIVAGIAAGRRLRILDVGCAQATLGLLLAEAGHTVVAVDLRPGFLGYAKSRHEHGDIRFVEGNALELDLGETFDVVFANQIIEHLVYPRQLLERLGAHLVTGGRLVVTTPSWHYIMNRLPHFAEIGDPARHEHRQFTADADGHFFAYRVDELAGMFRDAGYEKTEIRMFETPFASGHMKVRYLHNVLPAGVLLFLDRMALLVPGLRGMAAAQLMVIGCRV